MPSGSSSSSEPRLRLWLERGASGYWLRDAQTGDAVRWDDERLRVVKLAGARRPSPTLRHGEQPAIVHTLGAERLPGT